MHAHSVRHHLQLEEHEMKVDVPPQEDALRCHHAMLMLASFFKPGCSSQRQEQLAAVMGTGVGEGRTTDLVIHSMKQQLWMYEILALSLISVFDM